MGYYTSFAINISKDEPSFRDRLELISDEQFEQDGTYYYTYAKWYDYAKNMCELSKEFPNLVITVNGSGEEPGDLWQDYWKEGKWHHQVINITFDSFDPYKLQEYNE